MKSYCRFLLLILTFASIFLTVSCGGKKEQTKFIYKITDGYATVTGYSGVESEITVPNKLGGKAVKVIDKNAFNGTVGLKKVTLPDSVTAIDSAFVGCPDLTDVVLGSGIETMNGAFKDCPKLVKVSGGEAAAELSEAFLNCASLINGHIPNTATACASAFRGCKSLTSVTIDEGITTLPYTFEGCASLQEVTLPTTVAELDHTFENCTSLSAVTIGGSIKILKGAFVNCSSLAAIQNLPSEVESYSPSFTGCVSLVEMMIPKMPESESLHYDLASDVKGCTALQRVTSNSGFIAANEFCATFSGCPSLLEVTLPDEAAKNFLRVDATYEDRLFRDDNDSVDQAVATAKKASSVRTTNDFGFIGDISYTYISGGDVKYFSYEAVAASQDVLNFVPFSKSYCWCGYPKNTNRKTATVPIERIYTFYLRVTGGSDGSLPSSVIVNGKECAIENS